MKRWLYRVAQSFRTPLPGEDVARSARATGLVERRKDIGPVPFLWSFLFGTTQPNGSVTKVQNFYEAFTGHEPAYSSIQQWITPELEQLLIEIFAHLSIELGGTEPALGGRFERFRDVFITDATDCTLSPASFEDAVLNARQQQYQTYDIDSFTGNDALSADSEIGRFNFSRHTQWSKHQFHKIPREV